MDAPAARHRPRSFAGLLGLAAVLVAIAALLGGCGSALFASSTASPHSTKDTSASTSTTTTAPAETGIAVGIPVSPCTSLSAPSPPADQGSGGTTGTPSTQPAGQGQANRGSTTIDGWTPSLLLAPIPTALVSQVAFYSDGLHTVLAPAGWTCDAFPLGSGVTELVAFPTGDPDPPTSAAPQPGSEAVFAVFASTGAARGVAMACPYFTLPAWQQREAFCLSGHLPAGEQSTMSTPDVASVTDPPGVIGSLPGSGGQHSVVGAVMLPQVGTAVQQGQPLPVDEESCSLASTTLCPTILSDFEVREFPVPSSSSSSYSYSSQ
ncbi:MAG TPA: hypothetical protein VKW77_03805 [Acidimicrobiales bacterium]|nr:hypothetical protein [Acidimicrobiales bacterium]